MTVGDALRPAAVDLYRSSWRLLVLTSVVSAVLAAALAAASFVPLHAVVLLVPVGAVVGPFVAALVDVTRESVETGGVTFRRWWAALKMLAGRGAALGAISAGALGVAGFVVWSYLSIGGVWAFLGLVALNLTLVLVLLLLLVWPLAVAMPGAPLRVPARRAAELMLRSPGTCLALGLALLVVNVVGAALILPVLTITPAYTWLAVSHLVLPRDDTAARPGDLYPSLGEPARRR